MTTPPGWGAPSPVLPPNVAYASNAFRGQLLGRWLNPGNNQTMLIFAQHLFGVTPEQLSATERTEVISAIAEQRNAIANLPDEQFIRAVIGNPAIHQIIGLTEPDDQNRKLWDQLSAYVAITPGQPIPDINQQRQLDAEIWRTQNELSLAQYQGDSQRANALQLQLNDLNQRQAQFGATLGEEQRQFNVTQGGYLAGGAATLERQRIEADIAATNRRINVAESQGNADLALRERQRLDQLQMQGRALAQQESEFARGFGVQQAGLTGIYSGQQTQQAARQAADIAAQQAGLTGYLGAGGGPSGQRTLGREAQEFGQQQAMAQLQANPRQYTQWLLAGGQPGGGGPSGASPGQVGTWLEQTPLLRSLRPPGSALPSVTPPNPQAGGGQVRALPMGPPAGATPGARFGMVEPTGGMNPLMGFHAPVQQTLQDLRTNHPRVGLTESLASFTGKDPTTYWGEFQEALPRGQRAAPTRFR